MSAEEQDRLIADAAMSPRVAAPEVEGSGKDGVPGGQEQYRVA
jgi:hypothetical protein